MNYVYCKKRDCKMKNVMLLHPSVIQQNVVVVFEHVFEKPATGINGFVTSILNVKKKKTHFLKLFLSTTCMDLLYMLNIQSSIRPTRQDFFSHNSSYMQNVCTNYKNISLVKNRFFDLELIHSKLEEEFYSYFCSLEKCLHRNQVYVFKSRIWKNY